jgi:Fe-Mn family superoxide dismutase
MRAFRSAPAALCAARRYSTLPTLTKPAGAAAALPALDFKLDAGIAPVISPKQLALHYTKHHQAYITKLNGLVDASADGMTIEAIAVKALKDGKVGLFNQAAQHFNHSFYWKCLTPNGKAMPAALEAALAEQYGSVDKFKATFEEAGMGNFGSGWTWLVVTAEKKLVIANTQNAGFPIQHGDRPVFCADVWEHAYYKDFENRRADYLKEIWQIANWEFVGAEYTRAMQK